MENEIITTNQQEINQNQTNIENMDLTTKYIMENIDKSLIIFCNPISGNQEGKIVLSIAKHYLTREQYKLIDFQYLQTEKRYEPIKSIFFELVNKEDNAKGQKLLKYCTERCKLNKEMGQPEQFQKIRTLIAGGDGTVLSMIESFIKNGIDINYCTFGHVPLGTANDLSNSLGFSDHVDISENDIDKLYFILNRYYTAKFGKIDIWKLELQLDPEEGEILTNSKNGKVPLKDNNGNLIKNYTRTFINYVSLGYDARVGYNFDSRRTHSRTRNKCIYFCEGLKKMICRKTISVQHFIDTFTVYDSPDNSNQQLLFDNVEINNDNNVVTSQNNLIYREKTIKFQMRSKYSLIQNKNIINNEYLVLEGKPCSIIFQNIANYMSGVRDIWGKGDPKINVEVVAPTPEEKNICTKKLDDMAKSKQTFDDKMLEVFTFDNGLETGLEKIYRGLAKKIYHGYGPMEIKFLQTPKYLKEDRKNRIYLNLDGEFFHIVKPILLTIELNKDYCGGQLPFLIGDV
jgi:diacylglycerol kinase (ATP)